jgi:RHS repeat-associated protein
VGNVVTITAPTTNVTTNTHDADDRLVLVQDGGGVVDSYTYDAVGNQLTQTDGNGNTTTTAYDALYRMIQVTDPLGKVTSYTYDPVGSLLSMTDRDGNVTKYTYDFVNRRISMTDALGNVSGTDHTTSYQYDSVGNLIELTDANEHITTYAYDGDNRLVKECYADGFCRSYTYDCAGNIISRTDQNGNITEYTYSDLYFLLQRTYPTPPDAPVSLPDIMTYDLSGRMLTATRGAWFVTFAYDGANRIIQTVQNGRTITYTYNIPARIETITYPGGRTITESMDLRSRLSQINDAASPPPIVQYSYDPGNRVLQRIYRNSASAVYSYNNNNWIINLQHSSTGGPIAGFGYAYDNEGNKQFEQKLQDLTHSEAYQYDNIYRLIHFQIGSLVGSTIPLPTTQTQYTYDPVGNLLQVGPGPIRPLPETLTYNAANELTTITVDANPPIPLSYDSNGNLIADATYSYAYDEENRLIAVTRNADSVVVGQYQYDALSRRVQKIANPSGMPTTTRYFYDDQRIIEEQDPSGTTQATYVYGDYIDEVLTMDRGGQTYYYHQNALWSVEAITDPAVSVVERDAYDAYGAPTTAPSAIGNPYLFTGRQLDGESGIYFYRARNYDPLKPRFDQRDKVEFSWDSQCASEADAAEPDACAIYPRPSTNLYFYVSDNPINRVDPFGEIDWATATKRRKVNDTTEYWIKTDAGTWFLAWEPLSTVKDPKTYWCHGYTFEGFKQKNPGPFSPYSSGVVKILRDEWTKIKCCDAKEDDIVVWNRAAPTHSAVLVTDFKCTNGKPDYVATKVNSKNGRELNLWKNVNLASVLYFDSYNDNVSCYERK